MPRERKYFTSIDTWEDAKSLLYGNWLTRSALAGMLDISPHHASRLILHMRERGYKLVQSDEYEWHLEDMIPGRKKKKSRS